MQRLFRGYMVVQRISISGAYDGLYVKFLGQRFELGCNFGDPSSMELSFDEVCTLFASIASACENQAIAKVKIRHLSWTTDARLNPRHSNRLTIKFSGALGYGNIGLNRQDVLSACDEFSRYQKDLTG